MAVGAIPAAISILSCSSRLSHKQFRETTTLPHIKKMTHGDLFLRGLLPHLGVVLSLIHRITGVFGKKEK